MRAAFIDLHDIFHGRQHDRLLRLSFPDDDGPAVPLLVNRLDAEEALSRPFEYTVELLADDPHRPVGMTQRAVHVQRRYIGA